MRIGILQTGHPPRGTGRLPATMPPCSNSLARPARVSPFTDLERGRLAFPAGPDAADGWLITGSRHAVYEDHPFIAPLEDADARYAASVPLVGVCFGHQMIAQAMGGKVVKFAGGWSVGRQVYDFGGEPLALNAWHQDQVVERPPGAQVVASSPFCENAALGLR